MTIADRKKRLIKTILLEEPYLLSYEYRKQLYRDDRPVLDELLREVLIEQVSKDSKRVVYRYKGVPQ